MPDPDRDEKLPNPKMKRSTAKPGRPSPQPKRTCKAGDFWLFRVWSSFQERQPSRYVLHDHLPRVVARAVRYGLRGINVHSDHSLHGGSVLPISSRRNSF